MTAPADSLHLCFKSFAHTFSHLAMKTLKIAERKGGGGTEKDKQRKTETETKRQRARSITIDRVEDRRQIARQGPTHPKLLVPVVFDVAPFVGASEGQASETRSKNSINHPTPLQAVDTWVATETMESFLHSVFH